MINLASFDTCRVFVFQHLALDDEEYFQHFDCDEELKLYPTRLLSAEEHFALVNRE